MKIVFANEPFIYCKKYYHIPLLTYQAVIMNSMFEK